MLKRNYHSSEADGDYTSDIVRDLKSKDQATQIGAARTACSILCKDDSPVTAMVQDGIVSPLVEALNRDDCPDLRNRALVLLTYIAFSSCEHAEGFVNSGVIPKLITLLAYEDLAERAILALGNFALHRPETRDAVLSHGAVPAMLPYLRPDTPIRLLRTFVRAYSNLCTENNDDGETMLESVSPALPIMPDLLDIEYEESLDLDDKEIPYIARDVVVDACTALANIMHGPDECIEAVQAVAGLTERLVELLGHEATNVQEAALSAVGNMLAGTHNQVERCLDANCLDHIVSLLQCSEPCLVQEAARAAGNILAGTHAQIQKALEMDILTPLRSILASGNPESRKQAVYAVTNLCYNGSAAQRSQLVSSGVLEPYCALLAGPDRAVVVEVLDSLDVLLQGAERDGNVQPLCYILDELDVLHQMQLLRTNFTNQDDSCKISNVCATVGRHAREERHIVHDDKVFTAETIVQDLKSQELVTRRRAIRAVYYILREQNPPIHALVEAGIISWAIEGLAKNARSDAQCIAGAWVLFNITARTRRYRMAVVESGAIPKLIALLTHGQKLETIAAGALGNIALDGPETKEVLLPFHAPYTRSENALTQLRTYVRAYGNLCRDSQKVQVKRKPAVRALPFVTALMDIEDRQILENACQACTDLMFSPEIEESYIEAVQAVPGLTARLVALLGHENTAVQLPALIAVGNMLAGSVTQVDRCIDAGCLDHVISLMQWTQPSIIVEHAARATCNILRHKQQILRALQKDILTPLRNILVSEEANCVKYAACAIMNLCINGSAGQLHQLVSRGMLEPFCALLAQPDRTVAGYVLAGLWILVQVGAESKVAQKEDNVKPICLALEKNGAVDQLQQFLEQEIDEDLRYKAMVLWSYIRKEVRDELLVFSDGNVFTLAQIVQGLKSQELSTQKKAAIAARQMLCEKDPPRSAMVEAGVVPPLVAALHRDDWPDLQCIAAGALALITVQTHKHRVAVVNCGAIPKLVALLSHDTEVAEPAALALSYLTYRAPVTRDLALSHGVVQAMMPHLRPDSSLLMLRSCAEVYRNLCTALISSSMFYLVLPALHCVSQLLDVEDRIVLKSVCGALANLMVTSNDSVVAVQAVPGLATRLIRLLEHQDTDVRERALTAMGNMLAGTESQVESFLEAGCLEHLLALLQSSESNMAEQAARAVSNVLNGTRSQIRRVLQKDSLTPLLNILSNAEPNSFLQFNAVCALANFTGSGTPEHRMAAAYGGAIPILVEVLPHGDAVAEPAALALGNMCGDAPECTALVLTHGAVRALLPYLRPDKPPELLTRVVTTYKNICGDIVSASMFELVSPALPYISKLMEIEHQDVLMNACAAIGNLTCGQFECKEEVQAVPGALARLVALLRHPAAPVREVALKVFTNMLGGTPTQVGRCLDAGCAEHIVYLLQSKVPSLVEPAVRATSNMFRHSLSTQRALEKGLLVPLLNILSEAEPNSSLQFFVVGALNNLSVSGKREHKMAVVHGGGIPLLVGLLSYKPAVAELAALVLGYIARDVPELRAPELSHGAARAMLPCMRPNTPLRLWSSCVMAYDKLYRDDEEYTELLDVVSPRLPHIFDLQDSDDEQDPVYVTERSCGALVVLMKRAEGVEAAQTAGLTARLLALLRHDAARVQRVALVAVMYMLSGTYAQVDRCIDANCVEHVTWYLRCRDPSLMKEAADTTRSTLGATHPQLQRALGEDVLTPLMSILKCDPEGQKRIVNAISNLCRRVSAAQRSQLVSSGVLEPYCALLAGPDRAVVVEVLDSLDVLLQVAGSDETFWLKLKEIGVLDQIKKMQDHEDKEVNEKASRLLTTLL